MELWEYHTRLNEIFQSLLETVTKDVPVHDQVHVVLRLPQLKYPISLPFMPSEKLTSECILAEIEWVVQSNQAFRLDDSVSFNIVLVEMPRGGAGKKRREINLDKYLTNKHSIVSIQTMMSSIKLSQIRIVVHCKHD